MRPRRRSSSPSTSSSPAPSGWTERPFTTPSPSRTPAAGELRFGIGYHPAFNIPFDDQHTTTDYEFRFDRPESPVILDARPNGLLSGRCYYQWKNQQAIPLTDDLFANDSFCMAGLRTGNHRHL